MFCYVTILQPSSAPGSTTEASNTSLPSPSAPPSSTTAAPGAAPNPFSMFSGGGGMPGMGGVGGGNMADMQAQMQQQVNLYIRSSSCQFLFDLSYSVREQGFSNPW